MFLVSIAAVIVYTEMLLSYRMLMRSRARLEAQSIAFDKIWAVYNSPRAVMEMYVVATNLPLQATPASCLLSTNGYIDCTILPETNAPVAGAAVYYWDIVVQVWAPTNSPLQFGTNWLARYAVRRYWGDR